METVTIHRYRYKEIIKAVREKEDAGYDYVTPIRKVYKAGKDYKNVKQKVHGLSKKKSWVYTGQSDEFSYMCVMRKVD
ncbi:hypothetical protein IIO_06186 [Bacillus cereus VD115]|nr:hypothetical protein IIO_06186 [Bacillus cereus VD115]